MLFVLQDLDDVKRHNSFIFYPYFLDYAKANNYLSTDEDNDNALSLQQLTDLRLPHEMYPYATAMKRRIIYHEGPTNSGKTHQALERLKQAGEDGGIYCGPLRLLALEIYERMNSDGLYTSLVTGQEKKIVPYSTHVSCTVEMANINRPWDVAVIDEIQLIGDPQRGWAWTRALFGLQAKEIHVCGSGEAVHLVKKFAETTGDEFELRSYERRSPLEISTTHLKTTATFAQATVSLPSPDATFSRSSATLRSKPARSAASFTASFRPRRALSRLACSMTATTTSTSWSLPMPSVWG